MDPTELLDAIREACPPGFWSRAVRIARAGGVSAAPELADDDGEVVLRVAVPGGPVAFTVHLWPEEPDWDCDCEGRHDACPHAAAAAIAWARSVREGAPLGRAGEAVPSRGGRAPARVGYRLARHPRGFTVRRVAVRLGEDEPFRGSLASPRVAALVADEADRAVEAAMLMAWETPVERPRVPRLLAALEGCEDVRLDGEPVRALARPVVPIGRVEDHGRGFRARIVRDPSIVEVFRNGAVLCRADDGGPPLLRPVGDGGLSREQRLHLGRGVVFEPGEVGRLVGEFLPSLRRRIPVEVRTERLPEGLREPPRLVVRTEAAGETLRVRADVVYGDPPVARVVRGELELLGGAVPVRDEKAEVRLARRASEELGLAVGLETSFEGEGAVRFVDRLERGRAERAGRGWERFRRAPEAAVPRLRVEGDRLVVEGGEVSVERLVRAWLSGASLVPTEAGWAPLPADWLDRHGHLVADLLDARDPDGAVRGPALLDLARLARALDQPPPPSLERLRPLAEGFEGLPPARLPADLRAELRPYQRRGVDWLAFLADAGLGGILADDMGLGKTLQALCAVRGRTLVVAPTSVLHNWAAEARRFRPGLRVHVYHGPGRELEPGGRTPDLTITSYGLLRNDVERLAGVRWGTVVLDEAQAIKNPESRVARAAFRLQADFRVTLTGTPVENRLDELWSQFHFLMPGFLGGRRDFRERVEQPVAAGDARAAARLRERIRPFVLRRLKSEVAPELPPRIEMVLRAELSAEERAVYDAVRAATRAEVLRQLGRGGNVMRALEALLRLRQAACHPALLPGRQADSSAKVRLLVETLEEAVAEGHKALVFSQWTAMLDLVEPHLRRAGLDFLRLDGATRDRQGVVARFQAADGPPVFLISLKAGGTGLNLTAADHVFLVDPWWNPAAEDQAADRAHRIGQDRPVVITRLIARDTVEERILALQERKRALAEAALGDGGAAAGLTREDLLALLDG